ncbi:hypothetical protein [Kluyvera sichuanensis]|uniref:hypothetical protein n=1 Tax=Kluyvera sichuanensis TaxID=2725494 RepID=UPI0034A0F9DD
MSKLSDSEISAAMLSSLEGYVFSIVDSIEFEIGRKLTGDEQQHVHHMVNKKILSVTTKDSA